MDWRAAPTGRWTSFPTSESCGGPGCAGVGRIETMPRRPHTINRVEVGPQPGDRRWREKRRFMAESPNRLDGGATPG
jgi:hypothetical protein